MIGKFLRLIQVSRPYSWIVGIGMLLAGLKLGNGAFDFWSVLYILSVTFPLSIVLFAINDVYDYESDQKNPRKKQSVMGAALKKTELDFVKKSFFAASAFLVFMSLLTLKIWNIIATTLLIFFSYAYSAPPVRLKEIPVLESLSNAVIIYFIVILGYTLNEVPWNITYKAYYLLLLVFGYHIFSTIMDYDADKKAGHMTFAVRFGKRLSAFLALLVGIAAYFLGNFETPEVRLVVLLSNIGFAATFARPKLAKLSFSLSVLLGTLLGIVFLVRAWTNI
jgi:4-hydroxybenzoate polyprenyltransferase